MTDFLIRRFIKKYHKTDDPQVIRQYDVLSGIVSILCDIIMFVIKLVMGMKTGSTAVLADAYNNLSNVTRVLLNAMRERFFKDDRENRQKHRIDYLITLIVAVIIFEIGFSFFRNAFSAVLKASPLKFGVISVIFMIVTIVLKLYLSAFELKVGRIVKKDEMIAAAVAGRRELFVTVIAYAGMFITRIFHVNADSVVTLFVAVMVIWSAICIARDIINPLIKEESDGSLPRSIKTGITEYPGIVGVHDLVIKNYGKDRIAASVYAEISVDEGVEDARKRLNDIEKELGKKLGIQLIIHMDMVETDDIAALKARMSLEKIITTIDDRLSFSDFHLLRGAHVKNLIFDLNVPYDYNNEDKRELEEKIRRRAAEVDPVYDCVINIIQKK